MKFMQYWLNVQLQASDISLDLISIGLVCADGREFYGINQNFDFLRATSEVKEKILLPLGIQTTFNESYQKTAYIPPELQPALFTKEQLKVEILRFIKRPDLYCPVSSELLTLSQLLQLQTPTPEIWSYRAALQWVVFLKFLGFVNIQPQGLPNYCRDIQQLCDDLNNPLLPQPPQSNHALELARWYRDCHQSLSGFAEFCEARKISP